MFTVPTQQFALNGNVGWTIPTITEQETVTINAMGPHMHYTTTSWVAVKEDPAITNRSQPSYQRASDTNVNIYYNGTFGECDARSQEYFTNRDPNLNGENNCSGCSTWNRYFVGWATGKYSNAASSGTYPSLWTDTLQIQSKTATSWPNTVLVNLSLIHI